MDDQTIKPKLNSSEANEIKFIKKKGIKTERLKLGSDEALKIAGMNTSSFENKNLISKLINNFRYVKIDKQDIYLNIGSIAQRLGVSRKTAENLAKQGFTKLQEAAEKHEKALKKYNPIIEKFELRYGGLTLANSKHQSGLTPQTLLKSINIGLSLQSEGVLKEKDYEISIKKQFKEHRFTLNKDFTRFSFIQKSVGKGKFGEIFQVVDLNKGIIKAQKNSIRYEYSGFGTSNESLKNEHALLKRIHEDEKDKIEPESKQIEGIQNPTSEVVDLTNPKNENKAYYHTKLYSGNIKTGNLRSKFKNLPINDRIELCRQLFSGLDYVHKKGIHHSDIKPENCFFESDAETGMPTKFVIGDWGGSNQQYSATTPLYTPFDTIEYNFFTDFETQHQAKHDVFSLSKTVIETFLSKPIHKNFVLQNRSLIPLKKDSMQAKNLIKELMSCKVPQKIAELLVSGLYEHEFRPKASEIQEALKKSIENK